MRLRTMAAGADASSPSPGGEGEIVREISWIVLELSTRAARLKNKSSGCCGVVSAREVSAPPSRIGKSCF